MNISSNCYDTTYRRKQSKHGLDLPAFFCFFAVWLAFYPRLAALSFQNSAQAKVYEVVEPNQPYANSPLGPDAAVSPLSPVFTPEIQYWAPLIKAWAIWYQIDPNLIATVIQIESCGDPTISSSLARRAYFRSCRSILLKAKIWSMSKPMPTRGLDYLLGSLQQADGHVGLALAGYNGGHGVISRGWGAWAEETQRYYYWGSRIYFEAVSGMETSPTLQEWLNAGGSNLCARANQSLQQIEANRPALL